MTAWTRREVIGDATLYLGDCRDVLASMEGSVAHIITDPPYEAEAHTLMRRVRGRESVATARSAVNQPLDFDAMDEATRALVCEQAIRLCRGWFLAFCQAEAISTWREAMEDAGAVWKRAMVWVKPDSTPQLTGDRPGMGYESIATSWCSERRSTWNGRGRRGVFTVPKHDAGFGHGGGTNPHPTTKPQRLMRELVELFTMPGDVVLDPFMGGGSTGVACLALDRRFVGIERKPEYFDIACRRIEAEMRAPRLALERPAAVQAPLLPEAP